MTLESRTLLRLLDDDEWHPFEDIVNRLASTVPPGKALRRYDQREEYRRQHYGKERVHAELTEGEKIASGQRTLAVVAVHSLRKRYVELNEERTQIRRRPGVSSGESSVPEPDQPAGDDSLPALAEPAPARRESYACDWCGLYVVNHEQHDEFHRVRVADTVPPDVAFMSEQQIRHFIREEVNAALDGFQRGMQRYLDEQFDRMETAIKASARKPAFDPRLPAPLVVRR
jgi:hypothetical protein